jgi:hypothetical protein
MNRMRNAERGMNQMWNAEPGMNQMRNAERGMRNRPCHLAKKKYGLTLRASTCQIPHSAFRIPHFKKIPHSAFRTPHSNQCRTPQ